jgi:AcrR family transcriptional regulator
MSSNKRDNILNAALLLFVEQSYTGTTVPDIANKANVGTGTIYRYFESKEVLVNDLYQHWVAELEYALTHDFYKIGVSMREQFHHLIQRIIGFANRNIHALLFIDNNSGRHYLNEHSKNMFNRILSFLGELLESGKQQGLITPLPSNALIAIVYGALVYFYRIILDGGLVETSNLLASLEECCWNAIRVH